MVPHYSKSDLPLIESGVIFMLVGSLLRKQQAVAKFLKCKDGDSILYFAGYVYKRNDTTNDNRTKIAWQCRNKNEEKSCQASAVTDGFYVTDWKGVHIHGTNILQSDIIKPISQKNVVWFWFTVLFA